MPALSQLRRVEVLEHMVNDLGAGLAALRQEVAAFDGRFDAIDARFDAIDRRFAAVDERFTAIDAQFAAVRQEIREGDEETRRQMRVLHEEVISRLALLQEGVPVRATRPRSKAPRRRR